MRERARIGAGEAPAPRIYFGRVMHRRLRPVEHRFDYPVFHLLVPLSRVEQLENRLFGVNRPGLFSLRFRDYGEGDGRHPLEWARETLAREGLAAADGEIWLQTFPRVLGYVFNPVSFFFCHDREGELRAVLCEVNNTFGERHRYLLAHPDARPIRPNETLRARKRFHVSPFFRIEGGYRFRFLPAGERSLARIDYHDEAGDLLHTSIAGAAAPFGTRSLLRAFAGYPWMTLGVMLRIHVHALRLWVKRVPFFHKPEPPAEALTR
ncbi:MAG: DUF1365 family protein [Burkholderiales bacterium]|nr:DUF1365 family protein [Burkholderiales bacterium]